MGDMPKGIPKRKVQRIDKQADPFAGLSGDDLRRAKTASHNRCRYCGKPTYGQGVGQCKKCVRYHRMMVRKRYRRLKKMGYVDPKFVRRQWLRGKGLNKWVVAMLISRSQPAIHTDKETMKHTVLGMTPISVPILVKNIVPDPLIRAYEWLRTVEPNGYPQDLALTRGDVWRLK